MKKVRAKVTISPQIETSCSERTEDDRAEGAGDEEKAKNIVSSNNNYTWIRKKVINKGDEIDNVIKKYFPQSLNV